MAPPTDAILCYSDFYPPTQWEKIQELLGEDSDHDLWHGMTLDYQNMLLKASTDFQEHLEFDHQTTKTSEDFCLDPTNCGPDTLEMWRSHKLTVMERIENLYEIAEEEEPEELVVEKVSSREEPVSAIPLPEQPTSVTAATISDSLPLVSEEPVGVKPIGHGLPWAHIFSDYSPGYTTSTSTSTASQSIKWAPLLNATKEPRKKSRSRRLRRSFGFLRGLVCCFT